MKLLVALLALIFGIIGAGTLLEQRQNAHATPAPVPLPSIAAPPEPTPSGAWMWQEGRTALSPKTGGSQSAKEKLSQVRETTWTRTHDGNWIEHDVRVTSQQALGGGAARR